MNLISIMVSTKTIKQFVSVIVLTGVASTAFAQSVLVKEVPYYHSLPDNVQTLCTEKQNCPDIDINYIYSNQDWLMTLVNERVSANISVGEQAKTIKKQRTSIAKTDGVYTVTKLPDAVTDSLTTFVNDAHAMMQSSSMNHQFTANASYEGHLTVNNKTVEVFNLSGYHFAGGAHGLGYVNFVNIDINTKKVLTLDDILKAGKKPIFTYLLKEQFAQWVQNVAEQSVASYEKDWKFHVSDNFEFTKEGISITYMPYEISAYAYGMPTFTVSYEQLKGVLKDDYLQVGLSLR